MNALSTIVPDPWFHSPPIPRPAGGTCHPRELTLITPSQCLPNMPHAAILQTLRHVSILSISIDLSTAIEILRIGNYFWHVIVNRVINVSYVNLPFCLWVVGR